MAGTLQFFALRAELPDFLLRFIPLFGEGTDIFFGALDRLNEGVAFGGQCLKLVAQRVAFALSLGLFLSQGVAFLHQRADPGLGLGQFSDGIGAGALGRFPFTAKEIDLLLRFLEFGGECFSFFLQSLLLRGQGSELFFAGFEVVFEGLDSNSLLVFFQPLGLLLRAGTGHRVILRSLQGADPVFHFENAVDAAKPDFVAVVDFGLNDAVPVDKGLVGGIEILEPVFAVDLDKLGVMPGNGCVLNAYVIVGFPADGYERAVEAEGGFAFVGKCDDETPAQGRLGARLGSGSRLQPEKGIDVAKAQRVAIAKLGFGHGHAVEPAFVGRAEIFEPVDASGVAHDLGMVPRDGGILNLDQVIGGPTDGDHLFAGQFMRHRPVPGKVNLQCSQQGRLPGNFGSGRVWL